LGSDPLFSFSFSGDGFSGSGLLNATGDGTFTVVSGSGNVTGVPGYSTFASVVPSNGGATTTQGFQGLSNYAITYDNLLSPNVNPVVTINGLAFLTETGAYVNIYSQNGIYYYLDSNGFGFDSTNLSGDQIISFTVTQITPEPATLIVWSLLGGLGMAIGFWRRKTA
jgi:hypothetical protein